MINEGKKAYLGLKKIVNEWPLNIGDEKNLFFDTLNSIIILDGCNFGVVPP